MYSSFHGLLALLAPLRRLLSADIHRGESRAAGASDKPACGRLRPTSDQPQGAVPAKRAIRPPVRVVRILEGGQTQRHCGRLVISGRMADVCAELDRMVEREAALGATG